MNKKNNGREGTIFCQRLGSDCSFVGGRERGGGDRRRLNHGLRIMDVWPFHDSAPSPPPFAPPPPYIQYILHPNLRNRNVTPCSRESPYVTVRKKTKEVIIQRSNEARIKIIL